MLNSSVATEKSRCGPCRFGNHHYSGMPVTFSAVVEIFIGSNARVLCPFASVF
jgi:hypothetical protein